MGNLEKIKPDYYSTNNKAFCAIDIIDDWNLDFYSGIILKYVFRAGKKKGETLKQALSKVITYTELYINRRNRTSFIIEALDFVCFPKSEKYSPEKVIEELGLKYPVSRIVHLLYKRKKFSGRLPFFVAKRLHKFLGLL